MREKGFGLISFIIFILITSIFIIVGSIILKTYLLESAKPKIVSGAEITQKASFEVLVPLTLSQEYSLNNYYIVPGGSVSPVTVIINYKGSANKKILISQSLNPDKVDILKSMNLFKTRNPKQLQVNSNVAFIVEVPSEENSSVLSKLLSWNDDKRHINIWFTPSGDFTEEQVVNFASSLYR